MKNNQVDMILFAGDIGDLGTAFAFQTYEDAIDEVFGSDRPIIQNIMGNHDYWSKNVFTARTRRPTSALRVHRHGRIMWSTAIIL